MTRSIGPMFRRVLPLSFLLFFNAHCEAQTVITLKYFGLTVHPGGDKTAALQPYKLDQNARFVMNVGGFAGFEKFIYRDLLSLKVIQGVFSDCSAGLAMISHVGIRASLIRSERHAFYIGAGPAFFCRESWRRFGTDYESSGFFEDGKSSFLGPTQYKFFPIVAELEYDFKVNKKNHFSVSITPGIGLVNTLAIGWKHWLTLRDYPPRLYIPKN